MFKKELIKVFKKVIKQENTLHAKTYAELWDLEHNYTGTLSQDELQETIRVLTLIKNHHCHSSVQAQILLLDIRE